MEAATLSHKWPLLTMLEGRTRRLDVDLEYRDRDRRTVVPRGFICDLASIPKFLWWWVAPDGDHRAGVVIHDDDYRKQRVSRWVADRTMYRAMRAAGVRRSKASALWAGVRCFGWWAWRKNQVRKDSPLYQGLNED